VAEQSDLIHDVGRFVLTAAVAQAAEWHRTAPGRSPSVAVNISGRQLQRPARHPGRALCPAQPPALRLQVQAKR